MHALVSAVAACGTAAFGWIGVRLFLRSRSDRPLVVLDADGIWDYGSAVFSGVGRIPWREVQEVRVGRYQGLDCVEVVVRDRDDLLRGRSWLDRMGRSEWLGYPAVAFRGPLLPMAPARMVEEMRTFMRTVEREAEFDDSSSENSTRRPSHRDDVPPDRGAR